jgi:hypothetical protein
LPRLEATIAFKTGLGYVRNLAHRLGTHPRQPARHSRGLTVFLVAHQPVSYNIGVVTLLLLSIGYGIGRLPKAGRAGVYVETICLTLTTFLLMLPTVTETLRRVPDGHPLVTDLKSPLLLGAQGTLLILLIIGVTAQIIYLRRRTASFTRA